MTMDKISKQFVSFETVASKIAYEAGSIVNLPISSTDEVLFAQDAGDLVVTTLTGDRALTLENFFVAEEGKPAPIIELGDSGTQLTVDEIIAGLEDDFNPEDIAPALESIS